MVSEQYYRKFRTVMNELVIASYASKTLTKAERRTKHFRHYLYGQRFRIQTDHNSLRWVHNFKEPEEPVARWLEQLVEFDYEIKHRPGKAHENADRLSRTRCRQCHMSVGTPTEQVLSNDVTDASDTLDAD